MPSAELVVFLGNPGREHALTRHNYAWRLAGALSYARELRWERRFNGEIARRGTASLLKPGTAMNASGKSVAACARFLKIPEGRILVVHDDIELPFGVHMLKEGGGLGGHNGLRDIARTLGSQEFFRLRLGIGRPRHGEVAEHVLGRFSEAEEAELPDLLSTISKELESYLDLERFGILQRGR